MADPFTLAISKAFDKFGIAAETAARKTALDVQRDVMKATPVDTGLLRASWFVGVNTEPLDKPEKPDDGAAAATQAFRTLSQFKWGDTIYITNNQVYAWSIEYGHSKQAPAGMARITLARYQAAFGRW